MKIVIMGGSGFIGSALCAALIERNDYVIVPTRKVKAQSLTQLEFALWDGKNAEQLSELLKNTDAVINLIGHNIAEARWSDIEKERILNSRLNATNALMEALEKLSSSERPKILIQGSAVGFYGAFDDYEKTAFSTEDTPPPKGLERGFLAHVASEWEKASEKAESLGVKRVVVRTSTVLDYTGGALPRLLLAFKLFLGGALGSGKQPFAWIHKADEVGAILYLLDHKLEGTFNLCGQEPVTMHTFAKTLGEVMGRPSFFNVPAFILKMAFGQMAEEILLSGQKVKPDKLVEAGYQLKYPRLKDALHEIIQREKED
ncbi:TIGR01777 family oxidoreductase [Desulfovibrio litoralis]|uniref:TIGR01777 family protein n=1 Tax=Desulfovibrio litoralis DSM 11393 TaxID=1121455 RepID=A0A1M7SZ98_9BACT|nr:TIGR01777 family oxidoreductase [Desulfovibrio litoralis]SHN63790.1 hypothetical protein SAMN02745728_01406 [Desulfovibrio litoralis DSM 11393]